MLLVKIKKNNIAEIFKAICHFVKIPGIVEGRKSFVIVPSLNGLKNYKDREREREN